MTNQEALNYFRRRLVLGQCGKSTTQRKAFESAIEALEKQATSDWIPCSERLPEDYKTVIFIDGDGIAHSGYYGMFGLELDGEINNFDLKAWMPLPEAHEEGNEYD